MRAHLGRAVDVEVVALLVEVGVVKRRPRPLPPPAPVTPGPGELPQLAVRCEEAERLISDPRPRS